MKTLLHPEGATLASRLVNSTMPILLWIIILSQRLAVSVSGYQFSVGMIVFILFILFWLTTKDIYIIRERLVLILIVFSVILISTGVSSTYSGTFSSPSLFMLIGLYSWSIFAFRKDRRLIALKHFRSIMLIFSIVGVVQFLLQLIGVPHRNWLDFVPAEYIIKKYNYSIPINYGNALYKSNGIVFLEPSIFSQFVSLAIIVEMYYFKKHRRLFVLLPALLFSFSGTGLMLLAVGALLFIFSRKWNKFVISYGSVLLIFLGLFYFSGYSSYTLNRIAEFQNPSTSAYLRFISPAVSYTNFFLGEGNTAKFWFGLGPGATEEYQWITKTAPSTIMKLFVEYGIVAGLLFLSYMIYLFFSKQPFWLSLSTFTMFIALSGALLTPQTFVFYYAVLILHQSPPSIYKIRKDAKYDRLSVLQANLKIVGRR